MTEIARTPAFTVIGKQNLKHYRRVGGEGGPTTPYFSLSSHLTLANIRKTFTHPISTNSITN